MKLRTGFVSNSSSTSFSIVMTKKDYDAALQTLSEQEREFMETTNPITKKLQEVEMVLIAGMAGERGHYINDYEPPGDNNWKFIGKIQKALLKFPHIMHEVDC